MEYFVLVNKSGIPLSAYRENDHSKSMHGKLVYQRNNWISFSTREEAQDYLIYLLQHSIGFGLRIEQREYKGR